MSALPMIQGGSGGKLTIKTVGSYNSSAARSINVSSYLKTGDTASNFLIVPTSVYLSVTTWGSLTSAVSGSNTASISKSLSGTTLSIGKAQAGVWKDAGGSLSALAYINYTVYYVGVA